MANHKSAEKALRQTIRQTEVNRANRSRVRTFVRKVETALEANNKADAIAAFKMAESELMKAVTKGLHRKNTASRKISRLAHQIKALA